MRGLGCYTVVSELGWSSQTKFIFFYSLVSSMCANTVGTCLLFESGDFWGRKFFKWGRVV